MSNYPSRSVYMKQLGNIITDREGKRERGGGRERERERDR
jgi:hypothetical protein